MKSRWMTGRELIDELHESPDGIYRACREEILDAFDEEDNPFIIIENIPRAQLPDETDDRPDSVALRKEIQDKEFDLGFAAFRKDDIPTARFLRAQVEVWHTNTPFPPAGQPEPPARAGSLTRKGGSQPETAKIEKTRQACSRFVLAFQMGNHLDRNGKIGLIEFQELVLSSMQSGSEGAYFQKSEAKRYFRSSNVLQPFKRRRGERIGKSNS
jgi:hypothetical protein